MNSDILPATVAHLDAINLVIEAAKRSLGYDVRYVTAALPLLRIDAAYLARHPAFIARSDGFPIGFAALEPVDDRVWLLDHLWIFPSHQRTGLGTRLLRACSDAAIAHRIERLRILADPPSEAFYLRIGATRVDTKPSRIPGGPGFPVLDLGLPFPGPLR